MTIHLKFGTLAAATLAATLMFTAVGADASPSGDTLAIAKAAVLRILRERASTLGFTNVVKRPFAVCGSVHIRNANGEDGQRPFVYSLVSERAHVLDPPANPQDARAAIAAIGLYCSPMTG